MRASGCWIRKQPGHSCRPAGFKAASLAAEALHQQVRAERVADLSARLDAEQRASVERSLATIEAALQE
jgi:uncharacterized membrane protein YgcG